MFNDKYMFDNEWFYPSSIQFISLQIIKKKNSNHQIQQSQGKKKSSQAYTQPSYVKH